MSYKDGFDQNFESSKFVAEKVRDYELYPKVNEMLDYIVQNAAAEFEDVKWKNRGPDVVREEVIKEIITELGFKYIANVMDTITNFEFNQLLEFVSLLNLLKGSRIGLELVLKLLGFDSVITEWWEADPKKDPQTYEIVVIMNSSNVPDVYNTLDKVKTFARQYVFPEISNIDFKFGLQLASKNVNFGGFLKAHYGTESGNIIGSI